VRTSSHWAVRLHWRAILGLAVAVPLLVLATRESLQWIGTAFPSFLLMENAVVASVGGRDWPPAKAGLFHAEVVAIDGVPVTESAEVYSRVAGRPPGTPFRYALRRDGTIDERVVHSRTFSSVAWVEVYAALLAIGVLNFGSAIAVVFLQPTLRPARVYFWTTVVGGMFATLGVFLHRAGFPVAARAYFLAEAFFPAAFVHLGMVFPVDRLAAARHRLWPLVPYVIAGVLAWVKLRGFYAEPPNLFGLHANYVFIAASFVFFVVSAVWAYRENRDPSVRPRLRVVLLGILAGSILSFTTFVDNALGGGRIPMQLGVILASLFFLAVAYAIVKHDLFDVDRVVRQGFIYAVLSVVVVGTYAGVLLVPAVVVPDQAARLQIPLGVAFVLLLALALDPLRRLVQDGVDRAFYRSRVNYRSAIESLSDALTKLVELPEVVAHVTRVVVDTLQVESAAIALVLAPDQRPAVWARDHAGHLTRSEGDAELSMLAIDLARTDRAGHRDAVVSGTDARLTPPARRALERRGAALALPLFVGDRTIGVLLLGARRSGRPFDFDDVGLLRTVAHQAAMALYNARAYEELAALTRDLDARVRQRTDELHASNDRLSVAYTELQRAQAKLVHSEKMSSLGQLVAGVAHELNNPASFVYGSLTNLTEYVEAFVAVIQAYEHAPLEAQRIELRRRYRLDYLVTEAPELLRICAEGSERIKNIVADLKAFARPGGSERVATDLREGIESTLRLLQHRLGAGGITVVRDYREIPRIQAAAGELNQVWMNLLSNAADAVEGRPGAQLHVATRPSSSSADRRQIEIEIRDNGPGIDARHLPHIFEPFFTTKPVGQGTGLGLSIAYGAVKDHGGEITVVSTRELGTVFTVRLPIDGRAA
jgi:signal transduction histidine kinase